jgi:hypothetical protein
MVHPQQTGIGASVADGGEKVAAMLLVIGLTFLLAAPPMLQGDRAAEVCTELSDEVDLEASWSMLPIPHWTCTGVGVDTVHLGWWL